MIIARNLRLSFGDQTIFNDISFTLQGSERIGLFGLNGSGKSTLLKVIAGNHKLNGGTITIAKGATVAYLPQEVTLQSNKSILKETFSTFEKLALIQKRKTELEEQLVQTPQNESALEEYADICEKLMHMQPEQKKAETERMLLGLGFSRAQLEEPVQTLSVGWKMRIVMAKLLLQNADFYLFDEPTNHLDIVAKEWFLQFLKQAQFGFLLVCHEKRFLNQLCTTILELERGAAKRYTGGYDDYITQKEEANTRLQISYENQQREIKRMKDTINKFRAKASKARMAQSMIKKLKKIERIELPRSFKAMNFNFPELERSGKVTLIAKNISHSFGDKNIFKNASFTIERGQRVAIVAANGVGKTTLLNLVSGKIPLQTGSVEMGYNVTYAVFDQDQTASLKAQNTVFENACTAAPPHTSEQTIRTLLGSFLFSGIIVEKKAKVLSGGERNRLGMVKVLLHNANLLLLDEPTNHLDIPSKELLLKALQSYKGTILFVSHDYDFVNELATHIIELTPNGTALYHGNYDEYLFQKSQGSFEKEQKTNTPQAPKSKEAHEHRKKIRTIENKINNLEKKIAHIQESFGDLDYGTPSFDAALKTLNDLQKQASVASKEWELLHE